MSNRNINNDFNERQNKENLDRPIVNTSRKTKFRQTIDYNASVSVALKERLHKRCYSQRDAVQPDPHYQHLMTTPQGYRDSPMNCVCIKHVRTSINKNKSPINCVSWTPDGRRLITAAGTGEFTLWNSLTFNFETISQAHDASVNVMKWSHNEEWMLSGDDNGMIKYWQSNMGDISAFTAHQKGIRGLSFCPTDAKFVSCSADTTIRIWDFHSCIEERLFRGGEMNCVAWHQSKSLILSGCQYSQQPIQLWDPKSPERISTVYAHKSSCNDIAINKNGNWFLSASKDHTIKLFDLRNLKKEMQIFRGHKKDVFRVAWHPFHENLFASGSGDGSLMYWMADSDVEVGKVEDAHEKIIKSIDWHPLGHILATGSSDFATKFWTRNRPGDVYKESEGVECSEINEEFTHQNTLQEMNNLYDTDIAESETLFSVVPGLTDQMMYDFDDDCNGDNYKTKETTNRPVPKQFQTNWEDVKPFQFLPDLVPVNQMHQMNLPLLTTTVCVLPRKFMENWENKITQFSPLDTRNDNEMLQIKPPVFNVNQTNEFTQRSFVTTPPKINYLHQHHIDESSTNISTPPQPLQSNRFINNTQLGEEMRNREYQIDQRQVNFGLARYNTPLDEELRNREYQTDQRQAHLGLARYPQQGQRHPQMDDYQVQSQNVNQQQSQMRAERPYPYNRPGQRVQNNNLRPLMDDYNRPEHYKENTTSPQRVFAKNYSANKSGMQQHNRAPPHQNRAPPQHNQTSHHHNQIPHHHNQIPHHHNQVPPQHNQVPPHHNQEQWFHRHNSENPFVPHQLTGSSKNYIPLSFNGGDENTRNGSFSNR